MNLCHHQLSALLIASTLLLAVSFTHERPAWIHSCRTTDSRVFLAHKHADESSTDERQISQWDRRSLMESFVVGAIALSSTASSSSVSAITLPYDLDCLLDLPPVADDSVRIYLCRHAQTENNRLRLVQGARVDPPINYNGIQQSLRLGSALSRLKERCPQKILHSNLVRSKETAEFAARNIILDDKPVEVVMLPALAEVDFGPIADGQPVSDARGGMVRVVSAWVSGDIDMRPEGGGESGREVLNRSVAALEALVKEAEVNGGTVAAVAHSKFLKVLLAVVEDMPLAQAVATQQTNCCVDVLDMKRNAPPIMLGPSSNIFGGQISQAPLDFELKVPSGKVMRINEKRHLHDLELETMVG